MLLHYRDDGRFEMDNLPVGRALLGTSIGQRSYLHLLARIPTANVALRSTVSSAPQLSGSPKPI
ncbi:hypothetical protein BCAR13_440085 [Paraburkholderia caribensis]|nr:hypothetical protein BCAR13_440085 [Paraburkholderia caribensis]